MPLNIISDLGNRLKRYAADTSKNFMLRNEPDPVLRDAMMQIYLNYGHVVEYKGRHLDKYGFSDNVRANDETTFMLNQSGVYTENLLTDNLITTVTCNGYTGSFSLEYHTINGSGNFTFGVQTVNVVGGTATLATPAARVSRANSFTVALTADLYVHEDDTVSGGVPDTPAKTHLIVGQNDNNSLKTATTIEKDTYWLIEKVAASIVTKNNSFGDIRVRFRNGSGVPETKFREGMSNESPLSEETFIIVPPNNDVYMTGTADTNGRSMSGLMRGRLLKIR